jgi:RNase P subunit RPR2
MVFASRQKLLNHLRHTHLVRLKTPRALNPLSIELKALTFPTKCPREGCTKDRIYASAEFLRRHLLVDHINRKPPRPQPEPEELLCNVCNRSFRSKLSLGHHQRLHEKPAVNVTCEECGMGFKTKSGLKIHRDAYHDAQTPFYLCTMCPKTFKIKVGLDIHMKRHNNEKRYFCRVCPKGYLFRLDAEEHERFAHHVELGLEQIKCDICGKVYRYK